MKEFTVIMIVVTLASAILERFVAVKEDGQAMPVGTIFFSLFTPICFVVTVLLIIAQEVL